MRKIIVPAITLSIGVILLTYMTGHYKSQEITLPSKSVPATYTWIGAYSSIWTTSINWFPDRTSPAVTDILQFTDGMVKTVTAVPTQTIGKLIMANNTTINLQSSAGVTLTIGGGTGDDLVIPTGCSLNLAGTNAITIAIGTGATTSVSGNMTLSSTVATAHRLTAVDANAVTFNSGSNFTAGANLSGNPFGTTALGSVIFNSGSVFTQSGGNNPFGAGQPGSVVVFQTGSLFKLTANLTPSFSGRTYANFEMDASGITVTPNGGVGVSIDNLTVTNGTLNFNMTGPTSGTHKIKGNITVATSGILNFAPASAGTVTLNGTSAQSISGAGSISTTANSTLEITNSTGVNLNTTLTMNGNLKLTNGLFSLGSNNLALGTASVITGTPSATTMIVATGTGQLKKAFAAGFTGSFVYPVGDNTGTAEYSPVTLNFVSGTFGAGNYAGVNLVNAKYPTDPNNGSYLKRYWNITQSAITSFTCNALFQYLTADINGTENLIYCVRVNPTPFAGYNPVNTSLHQLTANGLTSFGTYTGTQPPPILVTTAASLVTGTTATLNGTVNPNTLTVNLSFEYGLTTTYGTVGTAVPPTVSGNTLTNVSSSISGLTANTTYHFRINGTNSQGAASGADLTFTTTCAAPASAGTVTGPTNVCKPGTGYVYTVPAIPNATTYTWTLPTGATITAGANTNTITVSFSAVALSGNVSVFGSGICGNGAASPNLAVTVNPLPVPTITGPSSACINSTGIVYTTETGMTGYTWTVSTGGTITSGTGSNNIQVTWTSTGTNSVTVNYTASSGCSAATPTSYPVTVTGSPNPTISGPAVVCANTPGVVYTTEPGMTSYNWSVSIGGTIISGAGTNAINVSWPYAGQRTVSVTYTTPIGCSPAAPVVYNVTVNPAAVPFIGSTNDPCINSTNNQYYTNTGMSNYVWAISPGGIIVSGQGTSTIFVTWTSLGVQWVSASFTNSYGCTALTPTVYNLFVNPLPNAAGVITGTSSICAGTNNIAYSCEDILNATSYIWSLPPGANIVSGNGTNHVTVNFGMTAVSGNITVSGNNSCGNGTASPSFSLVINPIPAAPVIAVNGSLLTSSISAGNQWYYEGTGAITGATGQSYNALKTGWYWCIVTINGCVSPESNHVYISFTGQQELQNGNFRVYPVPNDGKFTVALDNISQGTFNIEVYNQVGVKIFESGELRVKGTIEKQIDLGPVDTGIYFVIILNRDQRVVRKIVVSR